MIHLYNRTFLEIYTKTYKRNRSIVLNNRITATPDKSLFFTLSETPDGKILYSKPSLDDAITDLGSIDKVLQMIIDFDINSDKTFIYCDYNDYLRLLCSWLKTILPNLTQQAFTDIVIRDLAYRKHLDSFVLYDSQRLTTVPKRVKTRLDIDQKTANSLEEEISNIEIVWNTTSAASNLIYDPTAVSLEYQYARYLKDGNSWNRSIAFKNIMCDFLLNTVIGDIVEVFKTQFLRNLFVLPNLEEFQGFDPLKDDLRTWMGDDHPFKFVFDPKFCVNNLEYIKENYNLVQIGDLFNKYMFYPFYLEVKLYLNNANYDLMMLQEFNDKFGFRYLGAENEARKNSNIYLFYFINKLSKNDPTRLSEFSVR